MKTTFLMAVTSAKRLEELHALSFSESCLRWAPDGSGMTLWPNVAFLPKVLLCGHCNQPIYLALFEPPPAENAANIDATDAIRQMGLLYGRWACCSCATGARTGVVPFPDSICHTGLWTPSPVFMGPPLLHCLPGSDVIQQGGFPHPGLR